MVFWSASSSPSKFEAILAVVLLCSSLSLLPFTTGLCIVSILSWKEVRQLHQVRPQFQLKCPRICSSFSAVLQILPNVKPFLVKFQAPPSSLNPLNSNSQKDINRVDMRDRSRHYRSCLVDNDLSFPSTSCIVTTLPFLWRIPPLLATATIPVIALCQRCSTFGLAFLFHYFWLPTSAIGSYFVDLRQRNTDNLRNSSPMIQLPSRKDYPSTT